MVTNQFHWLVECVLTYKWMFDIFFSSKTIAQEVITALLNKYQITDNPRKFALYEQTCGSDKKRQYHLIFWFTSLFKWHPGEKIQYSKF